MKQLIMQVSNLMLRQIIDSNYLQVFQILNQYFFNRINPPHITLQTREQKVEPMINHPQKGIFTPVRTQPLTGRNANIQPTMFRRKQIFEKTANERFQTPFSGYSFTGSSVTDNNSLARSQVSQFSQENVIRLIKDELEKNGINSMTETSEESLKNKNELNILRIEIRSIKESYHELNKSFKKKIEEQNDNLNQLNKLIISQAKNNSHSQEHISTQLSEKIKEVEQDIAIKMRLIFERMQSDLRKELTNYANREFVPTSFLDDLDKQLNELDDRIANMENEYETTKTNHNKASMTASKMDKDTSVILSSGSELKLKQFERDLINLKKQLDDKSDKIKEIDESLQSKNQTLSKQLKEVRQTVSQLSAGLKQSQKEGEQLKETLQAKIEADKKKLFKKLQAQFQNIAKRIDQQLVLKSLTLSNSIEPDQSKQNHQSTSIIIENTETLGQSAKFQETRDQSKLSALSSSIVTNQQPETFSKTNIHGNNTSNPNVINANESKDSPKRTKKINVTYGALQKLSPIPFQSPLVGQGNNDATSKINFQIQNNQQSQNIYKVDKDGHLMDSNNKYILSSSNAMIFVSEKQIENIEKANLIKIEKWTQDPTNIV